MTEGANVGSPGGALYTAPLSFAQEGILFTALLTAASQDLNVATAYRQAGPFDAGRLERALAAVAARHAILRTTFDLAGLRQVVHARQPVPLRVLDLRKAGHDAASAAAARGSEARGEPFDIERGPAWRVDAICLADEDTAVVLVAHHLVTDDISMAIWAREVRALYTGAAAVHLPGLPVQYSDYAVWQHRWLEEPEQQALIDHWRRRLAGAPTQTLLPPDPGLPASAATAIVTVSLSARAVEGMRRLAAAERATPFMAGLAVFAELLGRRTGLDTVVVGSVVSGRTRPEIANSIGPFANILPLRIDRDRDASIRTLIGQVRGVVLDGLTHQAAPFRKIVERVRPGRDPAFAPLAQTGFAFAEVVPSEDAREGTVLGLLSGPDFSPFALELTATAGDGGGAVTIEYRRDLYREATVELLGRSFAALAEEASLEPDCPLTSLHTGAGEPGPAPGAPDTPSHTPSRTPRSP